MAVLARTLQPTLKRAEAAAAACEAAAAMMERETLPAMV